MKTLVEMVTPVEGLKSVDSLGSSSSKLDDAMCSCDLTNKTCCTCSNGSCVKRYSYVVKKTEKKLPAVEKKMRRTGIDSQ